MSFGCESDGGREQITLTRFSLIACSEVCHLCVFFGHDPVWSQAGRCRGVSSCHMVVAKCCCGRSYLEVVDQGESESAN